MCNELYQHYISAKDFTLPKSSILRLIFYMFFVNYCTNKISQLNLFHNFVVIGTKAYIKVSKLQINHFMKQLLCKFINSKILKFSKNKNVLKVLKVLKKCQNRFWVRLYIRIIYLNGE